MEIGSLNFNVLIKEFYCRHCLDFSPTCLQEHRSGMFFLVEATNGGQAVKFAIGVGETEGNIPFIDKGELRSSGWSGACRYDNVRRTCGGWYSLTRPVCFDVHGGGEALSLTPSEAVLFAKLLNESRVEILTGLIDRGFVLDDLGPWEDARPLILTYLSDRQKLLPLGATLNFISSSFKAQFVFGEIKFNTVKAQPRTETYYANGMICQVSVGKTRTILFGEMFGRRIAYHIKSGRGAVDGYECYGDYVHAPCQVDTCGLDCDSNFVNLFFRRRLGDIMFLRPDDTGLLKRLAHAREGAFDKVTVIRGELTPAGLRGPATLYHPEHGLLELGEGEYAVVEVPYVTRGHD